MRQLKCHHGGDITMFLFFYHLPANPQPTAGRFNPFWDRIHKLTEVPSFAVCECPGRLDHRPVCIVYPLQYAVCISFARFFHNAFSSGVWRSGLSLVPCWQLKRLMPSSPKHPPFAVD